MVFVRSGWGSWLLAVTLRLYRRKEIDENTSPTSGPAFGSTTFARDRLDSFYDITFEKLDTWPGNSNALIFGGVTDTWGGSLPLDELLDPDFGVALYAYNQGAFSARLNVFRLAAGPSARGGAALPLLTPLTPASPSTCGTPPSTGAASSPML